MSAPDGASAPRSTHDWIARGRREIHFGTALMSPLRRTPDAYRELLPVVRRVEELGFDSFWVPDHPLYYPDCWATLAALAVATRRLRLGSWVSCVYFRHPIQLARAASEVDRLSAGRLVLGVGMGDIPEEFAQLGIPYPKVSERQRRLGETVRIVRRLFAGERFAHAGEFFRFEEYALPLGPVQEPWVPLMIGGGGERVTLRQVAQYADMANFGEHALAGNARTLDDVRRKLAALDRHCAELGRDPATVLRSHNTFPLVLAESHDALAKKIPLMEEMERESMVAVTVPEAIAYYRGLIDAGMNYFLATVWGADIETLELLAAKVIPELREP